MNISVQRVEESKKHLAELGEIQSRTQFGGYSLSVEKIVFALVSDGELYLRASETMQRYLQQRTLQPFIFHKRGQSISLNYFKVDSRLWHHTDELLELSRGSLDEARALRAAQVNCQRLKDLPNLSIRLEMLLIEVGVTTTTRLKDLGAKQCWARLRSKNRHLGLKTLYALQGAISGQHQEVLAREVREDLKRWYQQFTQSLVMTPGKATKGPSFPS
ncbi:TfoX/Sxy family DNA transformation protein [Tatumella sp. UBA2305]|uniref:TfoX/Sxy family DNA transformation protein n=1 Tax=Tatumella sp. UBA2305 TaxID=1947647 RepID=UPI0025FB0620|nr:TfoX/Sxy family DNA transformation protein [Tatumella sp. UBA2305]